MADAAQTGVKEKEEKGKEKEEKEEGKEEDVGEKRKKKSFISAESGMPMKKIFRQRAHANPLSADGGYSHPLGPDTVNWREMYPEAAPGEKVQFADVGCGFGGLLIELGRAFPKTLSVGMEIRDRVSAYVHERILALREQHAGEKADFQNVALVRTNTKKYLVNYFHKGQLQKLFFVFPDPHFKKKNHRRCAPLSLSLSLSQCLS